MQERGQDDKLRLDGDMIQGTWQLTEKEKPKTRIG